MGYIRTNMSKVIEVKSCWECIVKRNKPCGMDAAMVLINTDYKNPIHPRCPLPNKMELPSKEDAKKILDECCERIGVGQGDYRRRFVKHGFIKCFNWLKGEK